MDNQTVGGPPSAEWYPDPSGRHELRFWDGAAWSDNVADRGQASVDPIEAAPSQTFTYLPAHESPAGRADQGAPAGPPAPASTVPAAAVAVGPPPAKAVSHRTRTFVVLALVLIVAIALGSVGYSKVSASTAAKTAASTSIAAARKAIAAAQPAVEPGSQELTDSQKSTAALDEATALYDSGSAFDSARYRQAKTKADEAMRIAAGITARVESMAANAAGAEVEQAIELYFTLYEKYPRTPEGQSALDKAAAALLDSQSGASVDNLDSIDTFCTDCPGDVPSTVIDAAAENVKSIASDSLDYQSPMVSNNKRWVKALRGKGADFTISGTDSSDTSQLSHVLGVLSDVQAGAFRSAVTLLRDSSKVGERCSKIARSPVRKKGNASYFSVSQVNKISSYSKQMAAKLAKARALLNGL